jgi:hypothetical protein
MSFAAIRPDSWNFPLLLHVLSAMVFVALLAAIVVVLVASLRGSDRAVALRFAFRTLWIGAIPAFIVMRGAAQWIASKENISENDPPGWIDIGYMVTDVGLLVLIAITVLAGLAARRAKRGDEPTRLVRWSSGLTLLLILAYAVALWAMATKPA